jgi:hypothetical protein
LGGGAPGSGGGGDPAASGWAAAARWYDWLEDDHVGGEEGCAWAYHFDVQTRFFAYGAGTPNTIATAFVALSFLDGYELLEDESRMRPALGAADYLVRQMLVESDRGPYFRYVPGDEKLIHNCNLLACAVLRRAGRLGGRSDLLELGARAVMTSLEAQRDDGSWPYSDWGGHGWVDNFHTGYVLESLAACDGVRGVRDALRRGVYFWAREMFLDDGTPKYFPDRTSPIDAHCYAQAIDTWLAVGGAEGLAAAERIGHRLAREMVRDDGSVVFQKRRYVTSRVPYVRWTAAPSFRALARLTHVRRCEKP